jgi:hypothetical protein
MRPAYQSRNRLLRAANQWARRLRHDRLIRADVGEALHTCCPMNVIWRTPPPRWRRNPPVGFIRPCELTLVDRPPE